MNITPSDRGWTLSVTDQEFHDLHHALRVLLQHPLMDDDKEIERLKSAADALWNAHCERVAA